MRSPHWDVMWMLKSLEYERMNLGDGRRLVQLAILVVLSEDVRFARSCFAGMLHDGREKKARADELGRQSMKVADR